MGTARALVAGSGSWLRIEGRRSALSFCLLSSRGGGVLSILTYPACSCRVSKLEGMVRVLRGAFSRSEQTEVQRMQRAIEKFGGGRGWFKWKGREGKGGGRGRFCGGGREGQCGGRNDTIRANS